MKQKGADPKPRQLIGTPKSHEKPSQYHLSNESNMHEATHPFKTNFP